MWDEQFWEQHGDEIARVADQVQSDRALQKVLDAERDERLASGMGGLSVLDQQPSYKGGHHWLDDVPMAELDFQEKIAREGRKWEDDLRKDFGTRPLPDRFPNTSFNTAASRRANRSIPEVVRFNKTWNTMRRRRAELAAREKELEGYLETLRGTRARRLARTTDESLTPRLREVAGEIYKAHQKEYRALRAEKTRVRNQRMRMDSAIRQRSTNRDRNAGAMYYSHNYHRAQQRKRK